MQGVHAANRRPAGLPKGDLENQVQIFDAFGCGQIGFEGIPFAGIYGSGSLEVEALSPDKGRKETLDPNRSEGSAPRQAAGPLPAAASISTPASRYVRRMPIRTGRGAGALRALLPRSLAASPRFAQSSCVSASACGPAAMAGRPARGVPVFRSTSLCLSLSIHSTANCLVAPIAPPTTPA